MKRLLLTIFISLFLCSQALAEGNLIDRWASDAEVIAQARDDKGITPAHIPSIMAAPGTIGEFQLDHTVEVLNANRTVLITDKPILRFDANGTDRNVLLPPEASNSTDLVFFIYNMSGELGEDLNIQDDAAAALETIHYGHMGICTCDGTTWVVRCLSCADTVDVLSLRVKEGNTSALVIGQPVYTSGATGVAFPTVGLADCDDANKIEVVGLVAEAISRNTTGYTRVHGLLEAVNSTKGSSVNPSSEDWTAGDQLYLSATVGGLTNVRPTSGRIIKVGIALTVEGSNSKMLVDIHRNPIWATAASGEDVVVRMGDSSGTNKVSYRDYANNEVASLDSDGKLTTRFKTYEKATCSVTLTAAECRNTLITNYGWNGTADQDFELCAAGPGLKTKFLNLITAAKDIYWDTPGSSTQHVLDGTACGDGERVYTVNATKYESIQFHTFTEDGTNWDWACDSVNGIWLDKGS